MVAKRCRRLAMAQLTRRLLAAKGFHPVEERIHNGMPNSRSVVDVMRYDAEVTGPEADVRVGEVTTGFQYTITPIVQDDNTVLLQTQMSRSKLLSLRNVQVDNSTTQALDVEEKSFRGKLSVMPGETTIVFWGADQESVASNYNWLLNAAPPPPEATVVLIGVNVPNTL